jgi:hypothetical protein
MTAIRRKPARDVAIGDLARIRGRYRPVIDTGRLNLRTTAGRRVERVVLTVGGRYGRDVEETYLPGAIIRTRLEEPAR